MSVKRVLTVAAVVALLAPPLARAVDVYGVLTNDSFPTQIDSVLWHLSSSPQPVLEQTSGWGGQVPMVDTYQFRPLDEWPAWVQLFYSVSGAPGEDTIDPLLKNQLYPLPIPGSSVMFTDSLTGIAERPGPATSATLRIGPNPLAGGTATVRYRLPNAEPAMLCVYSMSGRKVLTQSLPAGQTGTACLDLRMLDAGVYLVKAIAGSFGTTQKLVVQY